jgi:hypothetical protein
LYNPYEEIGKRGHLNVLEYSFYDISLCSDEFEHLQRVSELATGWRRKAAVTSAGFLLKNTALIFAN